MAKIKESTVKSEEPIEYKTKASEEEEVIAKALSILESRVLKGDKITSSDNVVSYLRLKYANLTKETFSVMFLNGQNKVICMEDIFVGTLNSAPVHPRDIVKSAILNNALSVILCHNHPSGDPIPSQEDRIVTKIIRDALALLDITVLDHVVVGLSGYYSFGDREGIANL